MEAHPQLVSALNEQTMRLVQEMTHRAEELKIGVHTLASGARVLDCGVNVPGSLQAGLLLARICLSGQAEVSFVAGEVAGAASLQVQVVSDHPVMACMASQHPSWVVPMGDILTMASGPMAGYRRQPQQGASPSEDGTTVAVGVLETTRLPDDGLIRSLSAELHVSPDRLVLLAAPASSLAGATHLVTRTLETTIHKLQVLHFDLDQILAGFGSAPLPPVAPDEARAVGRSNDAILYGGRAVLWVRADDRVIDDLGPKLPASCSPDHGAPFDAIFERHDRDWSRIDPMLFSPAQVVFQNLSSGRTAVFGQIEPDVLRLSFLAGL